MFFAALAAAFGLVAVIGTWKPALGLDLQGGTQIILTAKDSNVKSDQLKEAANIIDARVNGSGVSEATVNTQGSNEIVVQVPGATNNNLVQTVVRQAQLYFRLVAQVPQTTTPSAPLPSASPSPGSGVLKPSPVAEGEQAHVDRPAGKNRPPAVFGKARPAAGEGDPEPVAEQQPHRQPHGDARRGERADLDLRGALHAREQEGVPDPLTWMTNPDPQSVAVYNAFTCPPATPVVDDPTIPLVTCDAQSNKFLLSPALIKGTQITSASAGIPQQQVQWVVNLQLDSQGADGAAEAVAGDGRHPGPVRDRARRPGDLGAGASRGSSPTATRRSPATSPRARPRAWRPA